MSIRTEHSRSYPRALRLSSAERRAPSPARLVLAILLHSFWLYPSDQVCPMRKMAADARAISMYTSRDDADGSHFSHSGTTVPLTRSCWQRAVNRPHLVHGCCDMGSLQFPESAVAALLFHASP